MDRASLNLGDNPEPKPAEMRKNALTVVVGFVITYLVVQGIALVRHQLSYEMDQKLIQEHQVFDCVVEEVRRTKGRYYAEIECDAPESFSFSKEVPPDWYVAGQKIVVYQSKKLHNSSLEKPTAEWAEQESLKRRSYFQSTLMGFTIMTIVALACGFAGEYIRSKKNWKDAQLD